MQYTALPHEGPHAFYCNRCQMETYFLSPCGADATYYPKGVPVPPGDPHVLYRLWLCTHCSKEALLTIKAPDRNEVVPAREIGWRQAKEFHSLNNPVYETLLVAYRDTVKAFNAGLETLCAMGLRSCIEWICIERGATKQNLGEKIDQITDLGFINPAQKQALDRLRYMGNDAAHGLRSSGRTDLASGLVILESLIDSLYEVLTTAQSIRNNTP